MTERTAAGAGAGDVSIRVAALCLGQNGRLSDRLVCGPAVRGALLLDLALSARVEQTEDSILVDPTPTGFAPADRLLAAIGIEPERSLDGWLDERRIGLRDVADGAVRAGRWSQGRGALGLGRRYVDGDVARTLADLARDPDGEPAGWTPEDAGVTAIAAVAGLRDRELGYAESLAPAVLAATGSAAWLCTAIVDHLRVLTARYAAEAAGLGPF
ncbi:hypothetical protein GCM10010531_23830 [Blastococcus jejuensis]|uniref:Golgi phosphoprotein 3 (GPP34) n=1 Tax=Blastococcus jejuensis TaxID=351224 RepID=A0ABP6P9M4_9ACTN